MPHSLYRRLAGVEPEHERAVVEGGDEQPIFKADGRGDADDPAAVLERVLPVKLARAGVESHHASARPADQHPTARLIDHDRGGIGSRVVQGGPPLAAGPLVEGDDRGVGPPAHVHDHQVVLHKRCGGDSPLRHADLVFACQVLVPEHGSRGCIQAEEMADCAQRVGPALIDRDRRPRPGPVGDAAVPARVGVRPKLFAPSPFEAVDPLHFFRLGDPICHVDASFGDGWPAVSAGDSGSPTELDLGPVEPVDDPRLVPHPVPPRPTPLRPVVG